MKPNGKPHRHNKTGKRKKSVKKTDSFMARNSLALMIAGIAVLIFGIGLSIYCLKSYSGNDSVWVYILPNTTDDQLAEDLRLTLGNSMGTRVYSLYKLQGGSAEKSVGAYRIDPGATALKISRRIRGRMQTPVLLTFNNIRTLDALAEKVSETLFIGKDDFLRACDSLLPAEGFSKTEFPAAFLPDSYEVYITADGEKVVRKMLDARNTFWNETRRDKAKKLGLTPVQATTIASIVEEETSKKDEMGKIGRLYLNRFQQGMKLQADPTVKFSIGDFSIRRIDHSMLQTPSPYNTYLHAGLPPGPIRFPAASTIDALLDSSPHNYLYMCAREDFSGYHNFSSNYSQHLENARKYQQALDRRGIH